MTEKRTCKPPRIAASGRLAALIAAIFLSCMAVPVHVSGQNVSSADFVAGIVTDRVTKEPICGVSVYFEGQDYGEITDANGYYSIRRPEGGGTMVFSVLGYETRKIDVIQHVKMDVTMVE